MIQFYENPTTITDTLKEWGPMQKVVSAQQMKLLERSAKSLCQGSEKRGKEVVVLKLDKSIIFVNYDSDLLTKFSELR